jgi:hypothetical protein
MTPAAERYYEELEGLLRDRQIPSARVRELVADLRARTLAEGTHPYTAFGDLDVLADRLASNDGSASAPGAERLVSGAFGFAALALMIDGIAGIMRDHAPTFGIEPVFVVVIGLIFAVLGVWPLVRSGKRPRYSGPWWTAAALVAAGMAIPAAIEIVARIS